MQHQFIDIPYRIVEPHAIISIQLGHLLLVLIQYLIAFVDGWNFPQLIRQRFITCQSNQISHHGQAVLLRILRTLRQLKQQGSILLSQRHVGRRKDVIMRQQSTQQHRAACMNICFQIQSQNAFHGCQRRSAFTQYKRRNRQFRLGKHHVHIANGFEIQQPCQSRFPFQLFRCRQCRIQIQFHHKSLHRSGRNETNFGPYAKYEYGFFRNCSFASINRSSVISESSDICIATMYRYSVEIARCGEDIAFAIS